VSESIQEIFKRKLVFVGFERTMGPLGATTLGIGALMGAVIGSFSAKLQFALDDLWRSSGSPRQRKG